MLLSKWHTLNHNCQKFNAIYKRCGRLTESGENGLDVMKRDRTTYRDENKNTSFTQEDAWEVLPRPPDKQRPEKNQIRYIGEHRESSSSSQSGKIMTHELRLKWEAAEKVFEVAKEKDRMVMRLEEMNFLAIGTNDLPEDDALVIWHLVKTFEKRLS
nr:endopeptidase, NLPC/P60 domain, LRAT-like domain protein [Tanacetum cinerariifolium]